MIEDVVETDEGSNKFGFINDIIDDIFRKFSSPEFIRSIFQTILSIVMALIVAALIMVSTGFNPGSAFSALGIGALLNFDQVLYKATPLLLTGLSVALAFKCGLFNIGAEGQLYMGSIAATAVGYMVALPFGIHQLACIFIGAMAGLLYGLLPGILRAYRGAHEVVTTMMLSYAAVIFTQWLVAEGPMHNPGDSRSVSPFILPTAEIGKMFGSSFLSYSFVIALLCVPLVSLFINRTVMGYEMRAVGQNEMAAETAGINAKKSMALALGLSGALSGLAGTLEIEGYYHRFYDGWSAGLGFDGITVAVLGRNNPWGVLGGALFFGALKAGGTFMQTNAGVPSEMVQVIQGLVVLFVAAPRLVTWLSKHGVGYASWIKDNPKSGAISLVDFGYGGIASFLGILVVGPAVNINFLVVLLGLLICLAGLVLIVFNYQIDKKRTCLTFGVSMLWLVMMLVGLVMQIQSIVTTSAVIFVTGLILSFILMKVEDKHIKITEDEF